MTLSIAKHPNVAKQRRLLPRGNDVGYELFGIDMMLDDAGKVWLLECNDSPGLEYVGAHFVGPWPALEPPPLSPALPPALSPPTLCSCLQARTS